MLAQAPLQDLSLQYGGAGCDRVVPMVLCWRLRFLCRPGSRRGVQLPTSAGAERKSHPGNERTDG